ncbi:MAG: cell wall metabolism sensor histidine kinase WalK [Nanoarchaeota archaeon]|nr:cell wall metabolism sensor histidine kinase WalK [Nanoarchaeota archaeon]
MKISLHARILMSFLFILIIYLFFSALFFYTISDVKSNSAHLIPHSLASQNIFLTTVQLEGFEKNIEKFLIIGHSQYYEEAAASLEKIEEKLSETDIRTDLSLHFEEEAEKEKFYSQIEQQKNEISELQDLLTYFIEDEITKDSKTTNEKTIALFALIESIKSRNLEKFTLHLDHIHGYVTQQDKMIDEIFSSIILSGILILVIGLVSSVAISRSIVKPITILKQQTTEIMKGNYDVKLEKSTDDEIGYLTLEFINMVKELKKSRAMIKKHEKELELEVEFRTKELRNKIYELEKFQKVTLGRELKMIELKRKLSELQKKSEP